MSWRARAERCFERAQVSGSGRPQNGHLLGDVVWALLWVAFKPCFRFRALGLDHVRRFKGEGGALVVCNHVSFTDPIFHYLVIRPGQWPRFMAKADMMEGFPGWFLGAHGAFPVARDSADLSAVKRAVRFLKDGELVALFPEGTRRGRGDKRLRIHAGMALIARMARVPVIPSTVRNAEKIKERGKLPRFPRVTVVYGEPLRLEDFEWVEKARRLEAFSWYAMRECYALHRGIPAEDVDMPALFPDDEDYTSLFAGWKPGRDGL